MQNQITEQQEYAIADNEYVMGGLAQVKSAGFLSKENEQKLASIAKDLEETWRTERIWRTETEMRFSVLDDTKHPTNGMKYLQARREQDVFFRELMYLACDYKEKKGELLELEGELDKLQLEDDSKARDGKIMQTEAKIQRAEWQLMEMKKQAHHRVREVSTWEKIKKELNDGSFDPNDYESIQSEGLKLRWQNQLAAAKTAQATSGHVGSISGALSAMEKAHGRSN